MNFTTNKEKGNAGLALAIGYYGSNGYIVSIPLNDTQDYDLIVDKNGKLLKVQVKATGQRTPYGYSIASVSSSGGISNEIYKTVKDTEVDILFVVTELMELYEIPIEEVKSARSFSLGPSRQCYRVDNINTIYLSQEKNGEDKEKSFCIKCEEELGEKNVSGLCFNCAMKERQTTSRPTSEELLIELQNSNFSAVGRKYNVSDNAIRKWCKGYGLPTTIKEIKEMGR